MEQNGNGPKDTGSMLKKLADIRRASEAEIQSAKREGRAPVLHDVCIEPIATSAVSSPAKLTTDATTNTPSGDQDDEALMTSAEAAEFLGLSVKGLRNLASAGKVPHYKLFGHNRFKRSELLALLIRVEKKP